MNISKKKLVSGKLILSVLSLIYGFSATVSGAAGDLDFSFGVQGRQLVTVSTNPVIAIHNNTTDIVVQPDGKILVAGYAYFGVNPTSGDDFVILRFLPNGSLDSGFANGGIFLYDFQSGSDELYGIALQPDGKIVAVGQVQINPFNSNPNTAFAAIRLNPNGTFDSTFGTNGLVVTDFMASLDQATEVAIQPDGKILASGWSTRSNTNNGMYDFALVRYNANGTLDTSFGTGGSVFTDFLGLGDLAQASVLQPDGKIVLAGWVYVNSTSEYDFGLARYNPDGSLDTTFGTGGKVITTFVNGASELARGIAHAPGGKLVVTGDLRHPIVIPVGSHSDVVVARYNTNGTLDSSFDGDGKLVYDSNQGDRNEGGNDVIVQPDGKILIAAKSHLRTESVGGGSISHTEMMVIRLNVNGSFDNSFGMGGITLTDFGIVTPPPDNRPRTGDRGEAITLQPDGKIVVAGEAALGNGDWRFVIARFQNDIPPLVSARTKFDFDGDARADISVYRDGAWHLLNSTNGYSVAQFGIASDKLVPADYDADGKTDLAVFRDGVWYILQSGNNQTRIQQFGLAGDIPQTGDYDGDGRADLVVFRPSDRVWYLLQTTNGFAATQFGLSDDKPVAADYDGDGKTDIAVFRASSGIWHMLRSRDGYTSRQYGISSDKPVPADYDGDGKTDIAIYRDGTWWILRSLTNTDLTINFGLSGDKPTPADYDGDGKADAAVFRSGTWYLRQSTNGTAIIQFGLSDDFPVVSAFLR